MLMSNKVSAFFITSFKIFPQKDRNTGNGIGKVSFISKGM